MMTSAQVVETSVNVTSNSPSQDYTHPDDHNLPNYDMTPGFKPFTVIPYPLNYLSTYPLSLKPLTGPHLCNSNPLLLLKFLQYIDLNCFSLFLFVQGTWVPWHRLC